MHNVKNTSKKGWQEVALILVVLILFVVNYESGTYLIGWDNLQTELNHTLNFKRAFWAVWQEYQSFGLVSGMAHAADISRIAFLWLLNFILPTEILRYTYHFLMLLLGGLGTLWLIKHVSRNEKRNFAFVGALFYILNLGTIQIFYVPFEPFSSFFGFLPTIVLLFLRYLGSSNEDKKKNLKNLFLVSVVGTAMFVVQTLFVVFMVFLALLSFDFIFSNRSRAGFKKVLVAFTIIILANSFWLFPQIYFLVNTGASLVFDSKINQISTEEVINQNKEKGYLLPFSRLEGFYFDLFNSDGEQLFASWKVYSEYYLQAATAGIFLLALVGGFKRFKNRRGFALTLLFVATFLLSGTPPFSYINDFLRTNELINQIFRSPFSKFVALQALLVAIFLAKGLQNIKTPFLKFIPFVLTAVIIYNSYPAFLGNFFSDRVRSEIPSYYKDLTNYLNAQNRADMRIALFPDEIFWGWFKHEWGYEGSGFLWYQLEQPVVSRTFDVWSAPSESYFWEMKQKIESQDIEGIENVLEKYRITHLLLDETMLPISVSGDSLGTGRLLEFFETSERINLVQRFEYIKLYEFSTENSVTDFSRAGPKTEITNDDILYRQFGDYVVSGTPDVYFPFLGLMTQKEGRDGMWKINEDYGNLILEADISGLNISDYDLEVPEKILPATIFLGEEVERKKYDVETEVDGVVLRVVIKKLPVIAFDIKDTQLFECGLYKGDLSKEVIGNTVRVSSSERGLGCFGYEIPLLAHWNSYLIRTVSENVKGHKLFFYILGSKSELYPKVESRLNRSINYFVLNPGFFFDDGYTFGFQNKSYLNDQSVNKLKELEVFLFPYDFIKDIKFVRKGDLSSESLEEVGSRKINISLYSVDKNIKKESVVTLYQSFDPGWVAICGVRICNAEHVLVNNWANGWVFEEEIDQEKVLIFFWPQLLEFAGFFIVLGTFIFLLRRPRNRVTKTIP